MEVPPEGADDGQDDAIEDFFDELGELPQAEAAEVRKNLLPVSNMLKKVSDGGAPQFYSFILLDSKTSLQTRQLAHYPRAEVEGGRRNGRA